MKIIPKGGCGNWLGSVFLSLLLKEQDEMKCHVDICMGSFLFITFTIKGLIKGEYFL